MPVSRGAVKDQGEREVFAPVPGPWGAEGAEATDEVWASRAGGHRILRNNRLILQELDGSMGAYFFLDRNGGGR